MRLAYDREGIEVDLPVTPGFQGEMRGTHPPALPDAPEALENSLLRPIGSPPLAEVIRAKVARSSGATSACVVISDITRPVPNRLLLPPILRTLEESGVAREDITILIATGIHRPNEGAEMEALVGPEIMSSHRVVNHLSKERGQMVDCGETAQGIPLLLNRICVESDLRILTGFIEPHMWAGYSGGRKAILPGVASIETMRHMHGYRMVAHPGTRYGELESNPFHHAGLEVLSRLGADFIVNVTLDSEKRVTGLWSGDPVEAHLAGCAFLDRHCVVEIDEPLDFAVTTNAGAPLDCNLYQATKGITGAANIVREGGLILVAAACPEGVGAPEYTELLESIESPVEFLERLRNPDFFVPDQWCAQEMWQVLLTRDVWVKCDGISPEWLWGRGLGSVERIEDAVDTLLGRFGLNARWAVIPEGPLTITRLTPQGTAVGE
jgi:nickel-dependent lactate racemase